MKRFISTIASIFLFANLSIGQPASMISKYLNKTTWNELFRDKFHHALTGFYSYESLVSAADRFPEFLSKGSDEVKRRELAAFLANIAHETIGFRFINENIPPGIALPYADTTSKRYPPVEDVLYFGRGPIQLSWNYNYGQFSEAWFGSKEILLQNPALVAEDPVISFASALWFWTTPQFPKPSCHDIMVGKWEPSAEDSAKGRMPGFGVVMNVINGGLECGNPEGNKNTNNREELFRFFCAYFNVSPGDNIDCSGQIPFGR
jgi:hypothetical protein